MASSVDLMFKLFGHDETASKALKNVGKESDSLSHKLGHIGKMGAVSFAGIAAAASAFAIEGVHAAIKVEAQTKQLDLAIKNNTKATKEQTHQASEYLEKLRLQYGVSNEKLIPAYAKLVRATHDLGESQRVLNLAMNIAAATGKPLEAVTTALSKAYNGNFVGLTRLGAPIDKNILKTKDFQKITDSLAKTFAGAAQASTETFSGKMAILRENLDAAKEKIGIALLPMLTKFADFLVRNVVPNIQAFVDGLTGVKDKGDSATKTAHDFGEKVLSVFKAFKDNFQYIKLAAEYMALFAAGMKISAAVSAFVTGMKVIIGLYKTLRAEGIGAAVAEAFASEGASIPLGAAAAAAVAAGFGVAALNINWSGGAAAANKSGAGTVLPPTSGHTVSGRLIHHGRAIGGPVAAGTSYMVGERGPELFTPGFSGTITPNNKLPGSGMNVVVNVHGSVVTEHDLAVSVRDSIAQMMRRRGLNPAVIGV